MLEKDARERDREARERGENPAASGWEGQTMDRPEPVIDENDDLPLKNTQAGGQGTVHQYGK